LNKLKNITHHANSFNQQGKNSWAQRTSCSLQLRLLSAGSAEGMQLKRLQLKKMDLRSKKQKENALAASPVAAAGLQPQLQLLPAVQNTNIVMYLALILREESVLFQII
jgi:hypothetical protein